MRWGDMGRDRYRRSALAAAAIVSFVAAAPAAGQVGTVGIAEGVHAGEVAVPVNKSQVIRSDRPYARALIGNPEIADVLPLTDESLYLLGKATGTTSLTLYDRGNNLIAVVDVVVGPDVTSLKRQLSELMSADEVGARISNDSIVLEGIVSSAPAADRAVQLAETYAPGKVVNLLAIGSAQQVMLEVRFSEVSRSALKDLGVGLLIGSDGGRLGVGIGSGAGVVGTSPPTIGGVADSFGIVRRAFGALGANFDLILNSLETKGALTTLAEPTLVALSGETASFLAGGEFPVPVAQSAGGGGEDGVGSAISVEWKPFGVSLAFTPTVLADGVINLVVAPEVSSIDPTASIEINNLTIPGLQTRRARTVVELRDGESFMMAGLLRRDFQTTVRQFPILGSLPIIGTLFRSSGFTRDETELVIIVTPRLVRPVPAGVLKEPTDRVAMPNEADLFLNGRTDTGVRTAPEWTAPPASSAPAVVVPPPAGGMADRKPSGFEKEYGHVL